MFGNKEFSNKTEVLENKESLVNPEDMASFAKYLDWEKLKNIGGQIKEDVRSSAKKTEDYGNTILNKALDTLGVDSEEKIAGQNYLNNINLEIALLAQVEETKIDEIIKNNDNLETRNFSKKYHHPEYRSKTAKELKRVRNLGQDANTIKDEFYQKTAKENKNFEAQEKERSVSEIMKEKDIIFIHGVPMSELDGRGDKGNNESLNNSGLKFEETYKIIAGLEPTISISIPSPDRVNNGMIKNSGFILGEGKVLSAVAEDSGSVAFGLHTRIPKYTNEGEIDKHSAIQSVNIDKIVPANKDPKGSHQSKKWNELVVESPKIAGLYYDSTFKTLDPWEDVSKLRSAYAYDMADLGNIRNNQEESEEIKEIKSRVFDEKEQLVELSKIYEKYNLEEEQEKKKRIDSVSEGDLRKRAKEERDKEIKIQGGDFSKMLDCSEKMNTPLYMLKNEECKLNKYRVDLNPSDEAVADFMLNKLEPKLKEILDKNNNDENASEVLSFKQGEYKRIRSIIRGYAMDEEKYLLIPVTAKDILDAKKEVSVDERKQIIGEIKDKNYFNEKTKKEIEQKLASL